LVEKGFAQGDTLYILTNPRPEALLISIAAQWLGGVSAPLDPNGNEEIILDLVKKLHPEFIFAEGQIQIDQLLKTNTQQRLVIYSDARGLSSYDHKILFNYSDLESKAIDDLNIPLITKPNDLAFIFYRFNSQRRVEVRKLTHIETLIHGRQLIEKEGLTANEEALAARAFAASGHMRYLLAPWLLAGFKLNFPENIETRDIDRRELGPTLVAGTSQTYQRLENLITSRLPLLGTTRRALVNWSLLAPVNSSPVRKFVAYWLVIRPLLDVIGFSYTRVSLLVGEPLPEKSLRFFASLGIKVRNWPEESTWHTVPVTTHLNNTKNIRLADLNKIVRV
jgi:long-chain acyl-CoA synthetase